jgi:hypothetical protein
MNTSYSIDSREQPSANAKSRAAAAECQLQSCTNCMQLRNLPLLYGCFNFLQQNVKYAQSRLESVRQVKIIHYTLPASLIFPASVVVRFASED